MTRKGKKASPSSEMKRMDIGGSSQPNASKTTKKTTKIGEIFASDAVHLKDAQSEESKSEDAEPDDDVALSAVENGRRRHGQIGFNPSGVSSAAQQERQKVYGKGAKANSRTHFNKRKPPIDAFSYKKQDFVPGLIIPGYAA
ncbi:MAG: hypothetical protein LQ350_001937 [Teloschistes chrysophthalmus]|nr:MAG: hypothetical protein LQ350_001937 [Niorma chrysophthalma]